VKTLIADAIEDATSPTAKNGLSCAICQGRYQNPRMASCGHSFCRNCLRNYQKYGEKWNCPVCRAEWDPEFFPPKNVALAKLLNNDGKSNVEQSVTMSFNPSLRGLTATEILIGKWGEELAQLKSRFARMIQNQDIQDSEELRAFQNDLSQKEEALSRKSMELQKLKKLQSQSKLMEVSQRVLAEENSITQSNHSNQASISDESTCSNAYEHIMKPDDSEEREFNRSGSMSQTDDDNRVSEPESQGPVNQDLIENENTDNEIAKIAASHDLLAFLDYCSISAEDKQVMFDSGVCWEDFFGTACEEMVKKYIKGKFRQRKVMKTIALLKESEAGNPGVGTTI